MKYLIIALMLTGLIGCKTRPDGEWAKLGNYQQPASQKDLSSTTGKSGEIIIDSWQVQRIPTVNIEQDINGIAESSRKFAIVPVVTLKEHELPATIFSGKATLTMSDRNYDFYTSERPAIIVHGRSTHHTKGGIAVSKHGRPPQAFIVPVNLNIAQIIKTHDTIAYVPDSSIVVPQKYQGIGKTITYNGLVEGQVKFIYREFAGPLIRDAFTQEFAYDYIPGKEYSYKEAKFIVHEATPTSISITQTAHF